MREYLLWLRCFFNWLPPDPVLLPDYTLANRLHLWFEYGPLSMLRARDALVRLVSGEAT